MVGGGPAGATCARELARAGIDVLVLDRATFPRPKACAGWITPEVLPLLGWRADEYDGTIQPFSGIVVRHRDRRLPTDYGETVSYGILRAEFDERILRDAEAAGAGVVEGSAVERIEVRASEVEIEANGKEYRSLAVVGAGGHFCPVARALDYRRGERVIAAIETETRVGKAFLGTEHAGRLQLIPLLDLQGYAWIVGKGEYLNVGLGGYYRDLRARWNRFLGDLIARGLVDGSTIAAPRGHAYRVYDSDAVEAAAGDRHLLVGDAAGLARNYSGEGIRTAVESGLDAAATIREALAAAGNVSRESLSLYLARVRSRYGRGPGLAARTMAAATKPFTRLLAELVLGVPLLRREVVAGRLFGLHPL